MLGRLFSKYGWRWVLALMLVLAACAETIGLLPSRVVDRIDRFIYDGRMRVVPATMDRRIVIVDIDEKSLAEVGRWPWSRDTVAALVDRMTHRYKARAIAFDVLFAEPDTSSGYATLEALAHHELKDFPAFGERLRDLQPKLDFDEQLATALRGNPTVLSYVLSNEAGTVSKGLLPPPAFSVADLGGRRLDTTAWPAYTANLPKLQQAARGAGFINPILDEDGKIRAVPLMARFGDGYHESLSLATLMVATGVTAVKPIFFHPDGINSEQDLRDYGALEGIELSTISHPSRIPVGPNFATLVQFRGRGGPEGGAFRYVSAVDVLKERIAPAELANTIMLVGTTVQGLKDLRATPVSSNYPGVEIHANLIASMLDGKFKRIPDFSMGFELLQALLLGLFLCFALPLLTPVPSILLSLLTAVAAGAFNFWMYQSFDLVLPVASALLLIAALFIVNIVWGYLFEYRKGREIVNLFGEYVAPELVAEMAVNPRNYSMEGESRVLTVLFCDVRGFTTISEKLKPKPLREYINVYLTAMSEDIRGNRGTLDKYIGDAVMAFWGAPIALPDHASLAVATALKMQATAARLNREFVARDWPPLKIGIGLNTGEVHVGDMGSKIRRAYTVMGDAVNLSSRLEGITKAYGVGIAVGEATRLAAPEYAYRELDRVRVKGKNEPVPIFEPIALDTELDAERRAALQKWHAALDLVRKQQWELATQTIAALHAAWPDAKLYALYLQRIDHYRANPPGADWDGVTTFDTK